jgi:hypothetical protein
MDREKLKKLKKQEIRFLMEENLAVRFKILCIKLNLSRQKQLTEIIKNFVEIQEENLKRLGK